jgi:hypothetical protein
MGQRDPKDAQRIEELEAQVALLTDLLGGCVAATARSKPRVEYALAGRRMGWSRSRPLAAGRFGATRADHQDPLDGLPLVASRREGLRERQQRWTPPKACPWAWGLDVVVVGDDDLAVGGARIPDRTSGGWISRKFSTMAG